MLGLIVLNLSLEISKISLINVLPLFMIMADFNAHHALQGCEDINIKCKQLEHLVFKNNIILFNENKKTYFHSATGAFTAIDLALLIHHFSWIFAGKWIHTPVVKTTFLFSF